MNPKGLDTKSPYDKKPTHAIMAKTIQFGMTTTLRNAVLKDHIHYLMTPLQPAHVQWCH